MAIVVPFAQAPSMRQLPPMPDPQWAMMAAAMMHENGRLVQPEIQQVADTDNPGMPVRSMKSLQKAIDAAEGDDDLWAIRKKLEKRGISIESIPQLHGLKEKDESQ